MPAELNMVSLQRVHGTSPSAAQHSTANRCSPSAPHSPKAMEWVVAEVRMSSALVTGSWEVYCTFRSWPCTMASLPLTTTGRGPRNRWGCRQGGGRGRGEQWR